MADPEKKSNDQTDTAAASDTAPAPANTLTEKLALGPTPTLAPAVSPLAPANTNVPAAGGALAQLYGTPPKPTLAPVVSLGPKTPVAAPAPLPKNENEDEDEDPVAKELRENRKAMQVQIDKRREERDKEIKSAQEKMDQITKAYLAKDQALDLKEGRLGQRPTYKQIPVPEPKNTSLEQQWGSAAMVFAMLGSMMTRNHTVTALNAATAAMKGFQEGDKAATDTAMKQWEAATQNMKLAYESEAKVYDDIMASIRDARKNNKDVTTEQINEAKNLITTAATSFKDDVLVLAKEQGGLEKVEQILLSRALGMEKMDKLRDQRLARNEVNKLLADPDFQKKPKEEQLAALAATKEEKSVAEYEKYLSSKRAADKEKDEKLSALEKDPKYTNATPGEQLHMRAAVGDTKARDEISKMLAKQEQVRAAVSNPTTETQRNNDLAIASYMQEPPKQPASGNAAAKAAYEAQMERIRKINDQYNPKDYTLFAKAKENWTVASGQGAKNIAAMNTSAQHLSEFKQLLDALDTGDVGLFNRVRNNISSIIGFPNREVNDINAARRLVADEIVKSVMNSSGALADRDEMAALLNGNLPITQLKDNVTILQTLQGGRLNAMQKLFESGTGLQGQAAKDAFNKRLSPEVLAAYGPYLGLNRDQIAAARRAADVENRERLKAMGVAGTGGDKGAANQPKAPDRPANVPEQTKAHTDVDGGVFWYDPTTQQSYDDQGKVIEWDMATGKRVKKQ